MWLTGLIVVVLITDLVTPFKLRCVGNYLLDEKDEVGVIVYIGYGGNRVNALESLVELGRLSWTVIDHTADRKDVIGYPGNYLILGSGDNGEKIVRESLGNLSSNYKAWDPTVRVIVILSIQVQTHDSSMRLAARLIGLLWANQVYDTAIMLSTKDKVLTFSANPFADDNRCGTVVKKLMILRYCDSDYISNEEDRNLWNHPTFYPNCSIRVSRRAAAPFSFKTPRGWDGVDVHFVNLVSIRKKLNLVWSERPGPESGCSQEMVHMYYQNLSNNELDLAIGGSVMMNTLTFKVEYLRSHSQHVLRYYVANASPLQGLEIVHIMFAPAIWITLGFVLFFGGALYVLLLDAGKMKLRHPMFLMMVAILLAQPVKITHRWRPRLLLAAFLLPLYHISSLHLTSLQSFMVHAPRGKSIRTVKDLMDANLTAYISDTNRHIISNSKVYENIETVNTRLSDILIELEMKRNFSILARSLEAEYYLSLGHYAVHHLREGASVMAISMVMTKGGLYLDMIDRLAFRCIEAGFFSKWIKNLTVLKKNSTKQIVISTAFEPLDMKDVECAFVSLIAGCILSVLLFIGETAVFAKNQTVRNWCVRRLKRTPHDSKKIPAFCN